jgi:hypothetical protein
LSSVDYFCVASRLHEQSRAMFTAGAKRL